jgi:hypothetical protein
MNSETATPTETMAEQFLVRRGVDPALMTQALYDCNSAWAVRQTYYGRNNWDVRRDYVAKFGFAILTSSVVECVARYGPLVEVGCGSGYWAYELRKAGVDIVPTDPGTGRYFDLEAGWRSYVEVERIKGVEAVQKYPTRNLLTVWPDMADWPHETLQAFNGNTVLYVGEGEEGCTADEAFHSHLHEHFTLLEEVNIPQFSGIHDYLGVWRRKEADACM